MLPSCGVPPDITLSSSAAPVASITRISMPPEQDEGAVRAQFGSAVRSALQDRSVSLVEEAPLILEYSISARDAETGIADPLQPGAEDVTWQSDERKSRLFDGCDVTRLRAGLLLVERASGAVAYRGTGDMDTCAVSDTKVRQLAEALVADAIAKGALSRD